uniref:Uncharacterized protein n=1 Tax=Pelusios castaneus TaxID=367368 RepID=A0A8C8SHU9_9SAUR
MGNLQNGINLLARYLVEGPVGAPHLHHQLLHVAPRRLSAGGRPGTASLRGGTSARSGPGGAGAGRLGREPARK